MSTKPIYNPFLKNLKNKNLAIPELLELNVDDFLNTVKKYLIDSIISEKEVFNLDKYTLLPEQALYVINYQNEENSVTYQRGLNDLLGYSNEEYTNGLMVNYFHPEQVDIIQRIIKGAINYGINQDDNEDVDTWMYLLYKIKKKDGTYLPVLRQTSVYERDVNGQMISSFSIISDLTGISNADKVEWRLKGPKVDEDKFREYIYAEYNGFFTEKEKELLQLLNKNKTSQEISDTLKNSKHTVDTHRRNMLKKSKTKSTSELIKFAKKYGIINESPY